MSVNTSDEYLDELLQAIEPIIYKDEPVSAPITVSEPIIEENFDVQADMLDNQVESQSAEVEVQPMEVETLSLDNLVPEEFAAAASAIEEPISLVSDELESLAAAGDEVESIQSESTISEDGFSLNSLIEEAGENVEADVLQEESVSMDDLLAALTSEDNAEVEEMDVDAMLSAAADAAAEADVYESASHDNDVKELLKQFTDDEDLADIGDILERNDNNEAVDAAMLETPDVEVFQLEPETEENEETEPVKEKKGLFNFFKKDKKKKKGKKEEATDEVSDELPVAEPVEIEAVDTLLMPEEAKSEDPGLPMEMAVEEDTMDIGSLLDLGAEEILPVGGDELNLGSLFGEGDMTDIDQLLSAGSFEEIGGDELLGEEIREKTDSKQDKKNGSFFSRMMNMLLEEDEEEEAPKKSHVPEADATGITDENMGILDELSKEEKKKRKKEEKERKKKEKEAKKKGKALPEGEGEGDAENEGNEEKEKKKKKVKKVKPRPVVDIDEKPEKKLSRKKVSIVFLFCFSILAVILLFRSVVLDFSNLKEARWAFDNADYETCYVNLYGEELSEEDEAIFQKSYVILCVQRKLDSYENFIQMDMGVEALNALFDGIRVYRDMEERATELGILDRIAEIYQAIYGKLEGYGLSNEEIEEILNYDSKVTYTKRLESIVNGTPFEVEAAITEVEEAVEPEPQPLVDVLPQEEDFLPEDTSSIYTVEPEADNEEPQTTVVVGSSPVAASETTVDSSNSGTNVGNGDTNVSATVNGDNVVVF